MADIKGLFDKIEGEAKKEDSDKMKELTVFAGPYHICLWRSFSLLPWRKWRVIIFYNDEEVFKKHFKNYDEAKEFFKECALEAIRRTGKPGLVVRG